MSAPASASIILRAGQTAVGRNRPMLSRSPGWHAWREVWGANRPHPPKPERCLGSTLSNPEFRAGQISPSRVAALWCLEIGFEREDSMAIFILVHGGAHGGWCWNKLVPELE